MSLSDVECIKGLIKNRNIIDPYMDIEVNYGLYEAGDIYPMNQELIVTYIDLDSLIKRARLTYEERQVTKMYMYGYETKDIMEEMGLTSKQVRRLFISVAEEIKRVNDLDWQYEYVNMNHVKYEWNQQTCQTCKRELPATDDFYSKNNKTGGLNSVCLDCSWEL